MSLRGTKQSVRMMQDSLKTKGQKPEKEFKVFCP